MIFSNRAHKALVLLFFLCSQLSSFDKTNFDSFSPSSGTSVSTKNSVPCSRALRVTIVIDVYRAFTTSAYVLDCSPATYVLTTKSSVISRMITDLENPLLIGKAEIGASQRYDIPNSPTRVLEKKIKDRNIFHRTAAGAKGVLSAKKSDIILAAGFINAKATVEYVKTLSNPIVTIMPMGHQGTTPSLEDDSCAEYIKSLFLDEPFNIDILQLRQGPGKYFFGKDQLQYPSEDFYRCHEFDCFDFAIKAEVYDDFAVLLPVQADPQVRLSEVRSVTIQQINPEFQVPSNEGY